MQRTAMKNQSYTLATVSKKLANSGVTISRIQNDAQPNGAQKRLGLPIVNVANAKTRANLLAMGCDHILPICTGSDGAFGLPIMSVSMPLNYDVGLFNNSIGVEPMLDLQPMQRIPRP